MNINLESDKKAVSEQGGGGSHLNINQTSDEESDGEDDDQSDGENDDEEDDHTEDNSEPSNESSVSSDEIMQCNVCDRTFAHAKTLAKHQIRKKHFGCSVCETVFPSLTALEDHKQTLEHWSDEDNPLTEDDNEEHNNILTNKSQREELERLL